MAKVSVLMPAYNAEKYISEAIDSIIGQSFHDWELIIVNDGSSDRTGEIILSYSDKRIKYLKNDGNKGIIYSRKLMINEATGEYLAFIDSDDTALPGRLQKQALFLDNNPDYVLCGTWGTLIDGNSTKIKSIKLVTEHDEIRSSLLFSNTFIQSSIMIRRSVFENESYSDEFPVAEDYDLWCRLSRTAKLKNLPECLCNYRSHQSNISGEKKEQMDTLVKKIMKRELSLNLGINATNEEINIHAALRDKDAYNIPDNLFFKKARLWMRKLAKLNQKQKTYSLYIFPAIICFRWMLACKERGKYFKAFIFPIILSFSSLRKLSSILYARK